MKNMNNFYCIIICLMLLLSFNKISVAQVSEQDSLALVALYDSTGGATWTNHENWLTGPVATWHGITVSGNRVTQITLEDNNLTGSIPPEIGNLSNLNRLDLYKNQLTGEIPHEIGNLTNLISLYLSFNKLVGEIPHEIGNLINLAYLSLCSNQLIGEIPNEITNLINLNYLYLSINQLVGEIPVGIGNLTGLTRLDLSSNQLVGEIPHEIGNLIGLTYLALTSNQFVGEIPVEIGNLTNLTELYLYENQLSGEIPTEILNLTKLKRLYLDNNEFVSSPNFSSISTLNTLSMKGNQFTFEDIEPNIGIATFYYSPQDSVGERLDTTISAGESLTLSVDVGGTANVYQWGKDGSVIPGATETNYTIDTADTLDAGTYICEITNTIATKLTLYSREMKVTIEGAVGIENTKNKIPTEFALYQNYPNPFNPTTTIKYAIPVKFSHCDPYVFYREKQSQQITSVNSFPRNDVNVTLKVYNILGKEVTTLVNKKQPAGIYKVTFDASDLPSGVYIYQIHAGSFEQSKKLLLMK